MTNYGGTMRKLILAIALLLVGTVAGAGDFNINARNLVVSESPYVDVRAYGAVGDGATDDTAAIQAAIDYAKTTNRNVLLPGGIYRITDTLTITGTDARGFVFRGVGGDANTASQQTMIYVDADVIGIQDNAFNSKLENFGMRPSADTSYAAIEMLPNSSGSVVRDVYITKGPGYETGNARFNTGLFLNGPNNILVDHFKVTYGVSAYGIKGRINGANYVHAITLIHPDIASTGITCIDLERGSGEINSPVLQLGNVGIHIYGTGNDVSNWNIYSPYFELGATSSGDVRIEIGYVNIYGGVWSSGVDNNVVLNGANHISLYNFKPNSNVAHLNLNDNSYYVNIFGGQINQSKILNMPAPGNSGRTVQFYGVRGFDEPYYNIIGNEQRGFPAHGQQFIQGILEEEITITNPDNTVDSTIQIPANSMVYAVSAKVFQTFGGGATFTVTGATTGTAFNTTPVLANLGYGTQGLDNCPYHNINAQSVRITSSAAPTTSGIVRITIHYYTITLPAS